MAEGQITISEDKLYRALAEQELRILKGVDERLDKKVSPLEKRVIVLELTNAGENALASDLAKRADRSAMIKPTAVATVISALTAAILHFT